MLHALCGTSYVLSRPLCGMGVVSVLLYTVFPQLNAAVFISSYYSQVWCLFEGGIHYFSTYLPKMVAITYSM